MHPKLGEVQYVHTAFCIAKTTDRYILRTVLFFFPLLSFGCTPLPPPSRSPPSPSFSSPILLNHRGERQRPPAQASFFPFSPSFSRRNFKCTTGDCELRRLSLLERKATRTAGGGVVVRFFSAQQHFGKFLLPPPPGV